MAWHGMEIAWDLYFICTAVALQLHGALHGSRRGTAFLAGSGENIPNEREVHLNLAAPLPGGGYEDVGLIFQASPVTRPLMSVSKICRNGFKCIFDKDKAKVVDLDREVHCVFRRNGGLCVSMLSLKLQRLLAGRSEHADQQLIQISHAT